MTDVGKPYKQCALDESWDAIVIGSGIGGVTAAALLARHAGKSFWCWDVGVHYVGEVTDPSSPVRAAFDHLTDGRLQWNSMPDVYDRIVIAGRAYDFPAGVARFRDRMKRYFPAEVSAVDRYISAVQSAANASGLFFAEKALPRTIAWLGGPLLRWLFMRFARRTTASGSAR